MINEKPTIGIGLGTVIVLLGIYALVTSYGLQMVNVDDTIGPEESMSYSFSAPEGSTQYLNITSDTFEVFLSSPRGGLQINDEQFKNELSIEWVHLVDGKSSLEIQNTSESELKIEGYFTRLADPIQITFDFLVIIIGVIVLGTSIGFKIRKLQKIK